MPQKRVEITDSTAVENDQSLSRCDPSLPLSAGSFVNTTGFLTSCDFLERAAFLCLRSSALVFLCWPFGLSFFLFVCFRLLFERSEFLIATCKKKKTDSLSVCPDVRLILILVLGRQIVYGQNTVYLCLPKCIVFENTQQYKHHVVRSIARSGVSPPGARSDGHHWCQAARTAATCT